MKLFAIALLIEKKDSLVNAVAYEWDHTEADAISKSVKRYSRKYPGTWKITNAAAIEVPDAIRSSAPQT